MPRSHEKNCNISDTAAQARETEEPDSNSMETTNKDRIRNANSIPHYPKQGPEIVRRSDENLIMEATISWRTDFFGRHLTAVAGPMSGPKPGCGQSAPKQATKRNNILQSQQGDGQRVPATVKSVGGKTKTSKYELASSVGTFRYDLSFRNCDGDFR